MTSAIEALERLRAGNLRFAAGESDAAALITGARRRALVSGQRPFAVVVGCSDSRVPAEIVFDQGLGDLFVIRVAGNVVAPSGVGSVEFAAERFGTELVVVLGHTGCGAVAATLEQIEQPGAGATPHLGSIVDRIRPSVQAAIAELPPDRRGDRELVVRRSVRANARAAADRLRHGSPLLERRIAAGALLVVGAEYSLETGKVCFFDGVRD